MQTMPTNLRGLRNQPHCCKHGQDFILPLDGQGEELHLPGESSNKAAEYFAGLHSGPELHQDWDLLPITEDHNSELLHRHWRAVQRARKPRQRCSHPPKVRSCQSRNICLNAGPNIWKRYEWDGKKQISLQVSLLELWALQLPGLVGKGYVWLGGILFTCFFVFVMIKGGKTNGIKQVFLQGWIKRILTSLGRKGDLRRRQTGNGVIWSKITEKWRWLLCSQIK